MIGKTLGHYQITEKLGEGGMGVVFLANDVSLGRKVALKFLSQELLQDPVAHKRLLREAKAAAALDHPNICNIHEVAEAEGQSFIVMEYVEGQTLADRLRDGPLPMSEALQVASEVAEALDEAHERGIIHRDLKPANIMLTRKGRAKVMDFGLAKQVIQTEEAVTQEESLTALTRGGSTLGTLAYMSPEQLRGQAVDARSDIFSFGIVFYEMLTGVHPFRKAAPMDTASAILSESPPPLSQHLADAPSPLQAIVRKMLAKDPANRYPSAAALRNELRTIGTKLAKKERARFLKPQIAIPVLAAFLLLVLGGAWWFHRQAKVRWAKLGAIPEIERLQQNGLPDSQWWVSSETKFRLALEAEKYLPNDPVLARLMETCVRKLAVETDPPGAKVYVRHYAETNGTWRLLGITPLKELRVPYAVYRWRFEKDGYETTEAALTTFPGQSIMRTLDKSGTRPSGTVRVTGDKVEDVGILGDFYIDRCEVTNRQYKEFIDRGGYQDRAYWKNRFVKEGKVLSWEDAMVEFRDSTGRPGPATWEAGEYPHGQDDYPVSGISWYEAAAYAEYDHKNLPTVYDWEIAAGFYTSFNQVAFPTLIYQMSNFRKDGATAVGSSQAMNAFGAMDMAGNVREWCWNESPAGRYVRGGAWDDIPYMYGNWSQQPPWNRSPQNGFRCVCYIETDKIPAKAFEAPAYTPPRDFGKAKPVSDAIFKVYKAQFDYDPVDLKATVEEKDETAAGWIRERITFNAAYPGARVISYLYLPKKGRPPFQTAVFFPGSEAIDPGSPGILLWEFNLFLEFLVKNGRAVMQPMYSGTYERKGEMKEEDTWASKGHEHAYTASLIKWVKDFRRSVDYLETRADIDCNKLAFYGSSWGGETGTIIPAVEGRIRAVILYLGGLPDDTALPEASALNYVSRVKAPTLMLNGKYDMIFPLETSVKPAYDLLGTAKADKHLVVYDTDHYVPTKELVRECLNFLDRYLGPVQ